MVPHALREPEKKRAPAQGRGGPLRLPDSRGAGVGSCLPTRAHRARHGFRRRPVHLSDAAFCAGCSAAGFTGGLAGGFCTGGRRAFFTTSWASHNANTPNAKAPRKPNANCGIVNIRARDEESVRSTVTVTSGALYGGEPTRSSVTLSFRLSPLSASLAAVTVTLSGTVVYGGTVRLVTESRFASTN